MDNERYNLVRDYIAVLFAQRTDKKIPANIIDTLTEDILERTSILDNEELIDYVSQDDTLDYKIERAINII